MCSNHMLVPRALREEMTTRLRGPLSLAAAAATLCWLQSRAGLSWSRPASTMQAAFVATGCAARRHPFQIGFDVDRAQGACAGQTATEHAARDVFIASMATTMAAAALVRRSRTSPGTNSSKSRPRLVLRAAKADVSISTATADDYAKATAIAVRALKWDDSPTGVNETLTEEDYEFLEKSETDRYTGIYTRAAGDGLQRTLLVAKDFSTGQITGCVGCEVQYFNQATGEQLDEKSARFVDSKIELPVLSDLAVDPTWRGKGIARSLVETLENVVTTWGYKDVVLLVEATNTNAIGVYDYLGYKLAEERPSELTAYLDGGSDTGKPRSVEKRSTKAFLYRKNLDGAPQKLLWIKKDKETKSPESEVDVASNPKEKVDFVLQKDHGDLWPEVKQVLIKRGQAKSAEIMARARYSAVMFKDCSFLGSTERNEGKGVGERVDIWKVSLEGRTEFVDESVAWVEELLDGVGAVFGQTDEMKNLQNVDTYKLLSATEDTVHYQVFCKSGKVLESKDTYLADSQYGFIYSGESEIYEWKDLDAMYQN